MLARVRVFHEAEISVSIFEMMNSILRSIVMRPPKRRVGARLLGTTLFVYLKKLSASSIYEIAVCSASMSRQYSNYFLTRRPETNG